MFDDDDDIDDLLGDSGYIVFLKELIEKLLLQNQQAARYPYPLQKLQLRCC